jgi:hypothetical protein
MAGLASMTCCRTSVHGIPVAAPFPPERPPGPGDALGSACCPVIVPSRLRLAVNASSHGGTPGAVRMPLKPAACVVARGARLGESSRRSKGKWAVPDQRHVGVP